MVLSNLQNKTKASFFPFPPISFKRGRCMVERNLQSIFSACQLWEVLHPPAWKLVAQQLIMSWCCSFTFYACIFFMLSFSEWFLVNHDVFSSFLFLFSQILDLCQKSMLLSLFFLLNWPGSKRMGNHPRRHNHCYRKVSSNSNWFQYKTVTCRAELKLFKMLNLPFMSWATYLHSWQRWSPSKASLPSGLSFLLFVF